MNGQNKETKETTMKAGGENRASANERMVALAALLAAALLSAGWLFSNEAGAQNQKEVQAPPALSGRSARIQGVQAAPGSAPQIQHAQPMQVQEARPGADRMERERRMAHPSGQVQASAPPAPVAEFPEGAGAGAFPNKEWLRALEERMYPENPCEGRSTCVQAQSVRAQEEAGAWKGIIEFHAQKRVWAPLPVCSAGMLGVKGAKGSDAQFRRMEDGRVIALLEEGVSQLEITCSFPDELVVSFPLAPKSLVWEGKGQMQAQNAGAAPSARFTREKSAADPAKKWQKGETPEKIEEVQAPKLAAPLFVQIERVITAQIDGFESEIIVRRLSAGNQEPAAIDIELLNGEKAQGEWRQEGAKLKLTLAPGAREVRVQTRMEAGSALEIKASKEWDRREIWRVRAHPRVLLDWEPSSGAKPQEGQGQGQEMVFLPFAGESAKFKARLPKPAQGAAKAIDRVQGLTISGAGAQRHEWRLDVRSPLAGKWEAVFPSDWELKSASVNGAPASKTWNAGNLALDLGPGKSEAHLVFEERKGSGFWNPAPKWHSREAPMANVSWEMRESQDRWVLFAWGPSQGPAVLLWGWIVALAILGWGLGKYVKGGYAPSALGWIGLLAPLATLHPVPGLLAVGFICALKAKESWAGLINPRWWNAAQFWLMALGALAFCALASGVYQGLLGMPDMMIRGNGSENWNLRWFVDRSIGEGFSAGEISAPMWAYRGLMLVWALWIASELMRRAPGIWEALKSGGLWRKKEKEAKAKASASPAASGAPVPLDEDEVKPEPSAAASAPSAPEEPKRD